MERRFGLRDRAIRRPPPTARPAGDRVGAPLGILSWMTDVDSRPAPAPGSRRDRDPGAEFAEGPPILDRLCPYILTPQGWRSPRPTTRQRCTAIAPPARLASEKQVRLCLTAAHATCATYLAAGDARVARGIPDRAGRRPLARTAPVVMGRTGARLPVDLDAGARRWGQAGLIVLMVVALAAVVLARSTGRPPGPVGAVGTGPGGGTAAVSTAPGTSASAGAASNATPSVAASASRSAAGSPSSTPSSAPSSSTRPHTYTVQKGDTLSGIAARFGTTVAALQKANRIPSPGAIRVGQVLTIP